MQEIYQQTPLVTELEQPHNIDLSPDLTTDQATDQIPYVSSKPKAGLSKLVIASAAALVLVLVGGVALVFILSSHSPTKGVASYEPTSQPKTLPTASGKLQLQNVLVNGQLDVNNGLVLQPSSQPTNPTLGQLYFDNVSNQPYYYNGSAFISLGQAAGGTIAGATSQVSLGQGLSLQGVTLTNTGVTNITGTANQINVSNPNGSVKLSLPTNLSIAGSFSAASLSGDGSGITNIVASALPSDVAYTDHNDQVITGERQVYRNSVNDTSAFQIQAADGSSLVTADTTNQTLRITGQPDNIPDNTALPAITTVISPSIDPYAGEGGVSTVEGPDGFARIASFSDGNYNIVFTRCLDSGCDAKVNTPIGASDSAVEGSEYNSVEMAIGPDGFARIIYLDYSTYSIEFARCTDIDCTSPVITTLDANNPEVGYNGMGIVMGHDGLPRVAAVDGNGILRYYRCNDADCSSPVISQIDTGAYSYGNLGFAIGPDGFVRIAYSGGNNNVDLTLARCTDDDCSSPVVTPVFDNDGVYGKALAIASDGSPRITFISDISNWSQYYIACGNADCTNSNVRQVGGENEGEYNPTISLDQNGMAHITAETEIYIGGNWNYPLQLFNCQNLGCSEYQTETIDSGIINNSYNYVGYSGQSSYIGKDGYLNVAYDTDGSYGLRYARVQLPSTTSPPPPALTVTGDTVLSGQTTTGNLLPLVAGSSGQLSTLVLDSSNDAYETYGLGSANGPDGLPRLAYISYSNSAGNYVLKYARCLDTVCSSADITQIDLAYDEYPGNMLLTIGSDGFARILYLSENGSLNMARCLDENCSTFNIDTIDNTSDEAGYYGAVIAMGQDGLPRIAYDNNNEENHFVRCTDADCQNMVNTIVGGSNYLGYPSLSMAIGQDGFGRLSYLDSSDDTLKYIRCTDADCDNTVINTISSYDYPGYDGQTMRIGSDGLARIVYGDDNFNIWFARCTNDDCSNVNVSEIENDGENQYGGIGMDLGSGNLASISYVFDSGGANDGSTVISSCLDVDCGQLNTTPLEYTDYAEDYGTSLFMGSDGLPSVLYSNSETDTLNFAHVVSNPQVGTNIGSSNDIFGTVYSSNVDTQQLTVGTIAANGEVTLNSLGTSNTTNFLCLNDSNQVASCSGSGNDYINNGTSIQQANFAIQSANPNAITAEIQGAVGQNSDLLNLKDSNGNVLDAFNNSGGLTINDSSSSSYSLNVAGSINSSIALNVGSKPIAPLVTVTPGIAGGQQYAYEVIGINASESPLSSYPSIGFTVAGNTNNTLNWQAMSGAVSYNVYRVCSNFQYCGFIGNTTGTTITDTGTYSGSPAISIYSTGISSGPGPYEGNEVEQNNIIYVGQGNNTSGAYGLYAISISNPALPTIIGSVTLATSDTYATPKIAISGNYIYAAVTESGNTILEVVDISNPSSPTIVGQVSEPAAVSSINIVGNYAFVAFNYPNELVDIFDISVPTNPTLISSTPQDNDVNNPTQVILIKGNYAFINGASNLQIYNISQPTSPILVSTLSNVGNPRLVYSNYLYTTNGKIYDVTNPTKPILEASQFNLAGDSPVVVQDNIAYSSFGDASIISVTDLSNPLAPVLVGFLPVDQPYVNDLVIVGNYLYVGTISGVEAFSLGGLQAQSLQAVNAEVGSLTVDGNNNINGNSSVQNSISVGQNIEGGGNLNLNGIALFQNSANSTTAFQVQNSSATTVLDVDTTNGRVGIGTNSPANLLSIGALTTAAGTYQIAVSTGGVSNSGIVVQTVASQSSGYIFQGQNSTGATIASIDYQGNLSVMNAIVTGTLTINGHILTANTSGSTTAAIQANAGSGGSPVCTVNGNDTAGQITLTTGTSAWATGAQCIVSFSSSYGSAPHPVITLANGTSTQSVVPYITSGTSSFTINFINADSAQHTYIWNYFNAQ